MARIKFLVLTLVFLASFGFAAEASWPGQEGPIAYVGVKVGQSRIVLVARWIAGGGAADASGDPAFRADRDARSEASTAARQPGFRSRSSLGSPVARV